MKWIRTKDRLPEVNTRVIVSTPGREISVGELLPSGEGGWMYLCEDCTKQADLLEIEAWMPLPSPYSENIGKITQCKGNGHGMCKRCADRGKWNMQWMCFLYRIEGQEGCYCKSCCNEIEKEGLTYEQKHCRYDS